MRCRGCGLEFTSPETLRLGNQAIVKFKDSPEEKDDYSSLNLVECPDCDLVQLTESVPSERLYSQFHYLSGINQSMNDALFDIVKDVEKWSSPKLEPGDIVVDIGANDGTLLSYYRRCIRTMGFEPAKNISPLAGCMTWWFQDYFSASRYWSTRPPLEKKAKVITAIAMFYDLEDPNSFLKDIYEILDDNGIFVIQMNDLDNMTQNISVDNICHEHLCYYSMDTLLPLLRRNNLYPISVSYNGVNGGSIRVISSKVPNDKVFTSYKHNTQSNPDDHSITAMWNRFEKEKKRLLKYIEKHKTETLWAYGASTRGNTLLQLFGEDLYKEIEFIADRNPKKWGKYTAGSDIPICSEEDMRKKQPDNLLVLPYYFEEEFLKREIEYLKKGGKMIFPLPRFRILTSDKKGNLKVHGI